MRWRVRLTSAAPLQWPEEALLPGFRETFVRYVAATQKLSQDLLALVAEALSLPPNAFARFVEPGGNQDRAKIVKYPVPADDSSNQGVGPHYDGGFLTLVRVFLHGILRGPQGSPAARPPRSSCRRRRTRACRCRTFQASGSTRRRSLALLS